MNPLQEGLQRQRVPEPCAMVIFGASGDLARRKLVPAIYGLAHEGSLPPYFALVAVAVSEFSTESFREDMRQAVEQYGRFKPISQAVWNALAQNIHYIQGNFEQAATFRRLTELLDCLDRTQGTQGNTLIYLSTDPSLVRTISTQVLEHGLTGNRGWRRLTVEKPFGHDLASARALNTHLQSVPNESEIFRIDHYLGKETVQNILVLRFANGIFEPIWRNQFIDHVQITVAETLGVGTRAGYYEEAGAARDMMQNHMMQLLALVAMETPISLNAEQIRNEKVKVLQALRPIAGGDIKTNTVHAQYVKGYLSGELVPGYREEEKVSPISNTE